MDTNEMTAAKVTSETESRKKGTGILPFLLRPEDWLPRICLKSLINNSKRMFNIS
ncbi:MAG: hypothetical protein IKN95_02590 [Lachnospiraceae bacterium]|nr:hypothetical protein [Lachnospiraceae bacterium]